MAKLSTTLHRARASIASSPPLLETPVGGRSPDRGDDDEHGSGCRRGWPRHGGTCPGSASGDAVLRLLRAEDFVAVDPAPDRLATIAHDRGDLVHRYPLCRVRGHGVVCCSRGTRGSPRCRNTTREGQGGSQPRLSRAMIERNPAWYTVRRARSQMPTINHAFVADLIMLAPVALGAQGARATNRWGPTRLRTASVARMSPP